MSLLEALIIVGEKAANVARLCRQNEHLFSLLIEEKCDGEANPRFVHDFKTLADVLIQEMVKYDIGNKFPDLKKHIKGEESNKFSNKLGETIDVEILPAIESTAKLLESVLDGDTLAAQLLAEELHKIITINEILPQHIELSECEIDLTKCGIWIDPIDSTAEYINGGECVDDNGIALSGLKCVTVLIGVYDLRTGEPLIGVVNQPFHELIGNTIWKGKSYWNNMPDLKSSKTTNIICISSSENQLIKTKLKENGFQLVEAAGAGYKILTTINGQVDAYLLSKDSTFKWDTCGPQAILRSFGGDIVTYNNLITHNQIDSLTYAIEDGNKKIESCCNRGGIIAYRNANILTKLTQILKETCELIT